MRQRQGLCLRRGLWALPHAHHDELDVHDIAGYLRSLGASVSVRPVDVRSAGTRSVAGTTPWAPPESDGALMDDAAADDAAADDGAADDGAADDELFQLLTRACEHLWDDFFAIAD